MTLEEEVLLLRFEWQRFSHRPTLETSLPVVFLLRRGRNLR